MKLLVDNDGFHKLGASGLFLPFLDLFGGSVAECRRLASLPSMLRRGPMAKKLGERAPPLISLAESIPAIPQPKDELLQPLLDPGVAGIDPGEAGLFALMLEHRDVQLLTGDKRALLAMPEVPGLVDALAGRMICLEDALLALIHRHGLDWVKTQAASALDLDGTMRLCLPSATPLDCLRSFRPSVSRGLLWGLTDG